MSKKRKSNFRDKTVSDAKQSKRRSGSYLNLPKGTKILSLEKDVRSVKLDFIPYEVTDEKHPDRNDREERAVPGTLWYKRPFKVHRHVGADDISVICPKSIGKPCPVCEYVAKRLKEGAEWDDVKDIAAKDRVLYNTNPIDSENHDEAIHIWDMAKFLFQDEVIDQLEENPDNGVFPDLEEGLTLNIKLKWKKLGKNYYPETRDIKFLKREEQYTEEILEDVINLDEILVVLTYDELKNKLFYETEEEEDEDVDDYQEEEEEEEEPKKRTRKSTRKSKPKEEDEEEEEEEEKEEKKPARRSHKGSSKKNKCPNEHKFGVDWDEYDDCADCDLYDECSEAADE